MGAAIAALHRPPALDLLGSLLLAISVRGTRSCDALSAATRCCSVARCGAASSRDGQGPNSRPFTMHHQPTRVWKTVSWSRQSHQSRSCGTLLLTPEVLGHRSHRPSPCPFRHRGGPLTFLTRAGPGYQADFLFSARWLTAILTFLIPREEPKEISLFL